jgi:hypothetical protein
MMTRGQRRDLSYRPDDRPMDRLNAWVERRRGVLTLAGIIAAPLLAILAAVAAVKVELGYAQSTPAQRIAAIHTRVDSLASVQAAQAARVDTIARQNRAILIDLCFRVSDQVLPYIRTEVDCFDLTGGRRR